MWPFIKWLSRSVMRPSQLINKYHSCGTLRLITRIKKLPFHNIWCHILIWLHWAALVHARKEWRWSDWRFLVGVPSLETELWKKRHKRPFSKTTYSIYNKYNMYYYWYYMRNNKIYCIILAGKYILLASSWSELVIYLY